MIKISRIATAAAIFTAAAVLGGGELLAQTTPAPKPTICTRSCWGATSNGLSSTMSLNRAIIHHTAGTYGNSSLTHSKSIMRAIQSQHKNQGWLDIGYHFVCDALGNIFEGRRGSTTSSTFYRGAHDGTNTSSYGFSNMGNFEFNTFTTAGKNANWDVIAWRMPSGWSPYGSGTYNGKTVGRTAGHLNVKSTACPGTNIYTTIGTNYNGGTARNAIAARRTPGSSTSDRLDVVVRGSSNRVMRRVWIRGDGWTDWSSMGGAIQGPPEIVVRGLEHGGSSQRRGLVFVRDFNDELRYRIWIPGNGWSGWEHGGGTLTSAPRATLWGVDPYVVVGGPNNNVYRRILRDDAWTGSWSNRGGHTVGPPTISAQGANRVDIYTRGADNNLHHLFWTSSGGWSNWFNRGGSLTSGPSAVAWLGGDYIVARRSDGEVQRVIRDSNGSFNSWQGKGGNIVGSPGVGSFDGEMIYIVARGLTSNEVWRRSWQNNSWDDWSKLGGGGASDWASSEPNVDGSQW